MASVTIDRLASPATWRCFQSNSKSQYGEEAVILQLLWLLLKRAGHRSATPQAVSDDRRCTEVELGPSCGMFLELGALDGMQISNTLALERCLGG